MYSDHICTKLIIIIIIVTIMHCYLLFSYVFSVHNTAIALYSKSRTLADKRLLETKELKETTSALTMQLEQRDVEIRQLKEEIMKLSTSSLTLLLEYRDEEITLLKKEIKKLQESFEGDLVFHSYKCTF